MNRSLLNVNEFISPEERRSIISYGQSRVIIVSFPLTAE